MELESVRALKQELMATTLRPRRRVRRVRRGLLRRSDGSLEMGRTMGSPPQLLLPPPPIALGVAVGEDGGYSLAVRVQDERQLKTKAMGEIKRRAAGEVDIRYIGRPVPAGGTSWHRGRCEPLRGGTSIGSQPQRTTGTLGCFLEPCQGGPPHLLSNAHVLAGWGAGKKGDSILQPGWDDKGRGHPPIASLSHLVDLGSKGRDDDDCAAAELLDGAEPEVASGLVAANPDIDEDVSKDGRTTGRTEGRVLAIEVGTVEVDYPRPLGTLRFDDLIEVDGEGTEPFAAHGDSGSVVVAGKERAVGLLFAVTGKGGRNGRGVAYLAPLDRVLRRLDMRLVP